MSCRPEIPGLGVPIEGAGKWRDGSTAREDTDKVLPLVEEMLAGRYKTGQAIPGWDGKAAVRIVEALGARYGTTSTPRS